MAEPHPHARSQDPKLTTPPSGIPPSGIPPSDDTSASATGPAQQTGGDVINNNEPSPRTTASATTQPAFSARNTNIMSPTDQRQSVVSNQTWSDTIALVEGLGPLIKTFTLLVGGGESGSDLDCFDAALAKSADVLQRLRGLEEKWQHLDGQFTSKNEEFSGLEASLKVLKYKAAHLTSEIQVHEDNLLKVKSRKKDLLICVQTVQNRLEEAEAKLLVAQRAHGDIDGKLERLAMATGNLKNEEAAMGYTSEGSRSEGKSSGLMLTKLWDKWFNYETGHAKFVHREQAWVRRELLIEEKERILHSRQETLDSQIAAVKKDSDDMALQKVNFEQDQNYLYTKQRECQQEMTRLCSLRTATEEKASSTEAHLRNLRVIVRSMRDALRFGSCTDVPHESADLSEEGKHLSAMLRSELTRLESADKNNQAEICRLNSEAATAGRAFDEFRKRKEDEAVAAGRLFDEFRKRKEDEAGAAGRLFDEFRKTKDAAVGRLDKLLTTALEGQSASEVENERLRHELDAAKFRQSEAEAKLGVAEQKVANEQRHNNDRKRKLDLQEDELRSSKRQATELETRAQTAEEKAHQLDVAQTTLSNLQARLQRSESMVTQTRTMYNDLLAKARNTETRNSELTRTIQRQQAQIREFTKEKEEEQGKRRRLDAQIDEVERMKDNLTTELQEAQNKIELAGKIVARNFFLKWWERVQRQLASKRKKGST